MLLHREYNCHFFTKTYLVKIASFREILLNSYTKILPSSATTTNTANITSTITTINTTTIINTYTIITTTNTTISTSANLYYPYVLYYSGSRNYFIILKRVNNSYSI